MTSVTLPSTPAPSAAEFTVVDFGGEIVSPLGGATQRVNRVGTRMSMSITLPPMETDNGLAWRSALVRGKLDGVLMTVPQPGLTIGSPGSPVVDGAGQTGSTLVVKSGAAAYAYRNGQWISIVAGGRRYLHMITSAVTASGAGAASLSIWPPLRVSPANNASVEVSAPKIEGYLQGEDVTWSIDVIGLTGLKFMITEAA